MPIQQGHNRHPGSESHFWTDRHFSRQSVVQALKNAQKLQSEAKQAQKPSCEPNSGNPVSGSVDWAQMLNFG